MPKKRKTRKQKILTDQKHYVVQEGEPLDSSSQKMEPQSTQENISSGMTFSLPTQNTKPSSQQLKSSPQTVAISTSEYGYLGKDLMRTMLLTGAIVLAELLIKILFKG